MSLSKRDGQNNKRREDRADKPPKRCGIIFFNKNFFIEEKRESEILNGLKNKNNK